MKNLLLVFLLATFMFSCNETDRKLEGSTEDDANTATTFIRFALDGNFDKARKLMVEDSLAQLDMDAIKRVYETMSPQEKAKYRSASIMIHERKLLDSITSAITYSNSYRNKVDSLKLIKVDGEWKVKFRLFPDENK